MMFSIRNFALLLLGAASLAAVACGSERVVEVTVQTEIIRTVEVEVPVEVQKEVVREVEVEVPIEVEKEVVREVVKEIPVEVEKEVVREVVKEVAVEVVITATPQITTIDAPIKKVNIEGVSRGAGDDVEPQGILVAAIGNSYFMNSSPRYCPACSVTARTGSTETLLEAVRADDGTVALGPLLATDWEMSADGASYTDFTLREGVQFHGGYGEMTAADVAFSWNDANPKLQPDSVHDTGGDLANLVQEVEILDDYKVRFHWIAFGGNTLLQYLTNFHEGISVFSKDFFDEVGAEGMRTKLIGTGPFEVDQWIQHSGVFS